MYKSLMADLLSIKGSLADTIDLAHRHGFAGVDAGPGMLTDPALDIESVRDGLQATKLRPGYVMMSPVRVPVPEDDWQAALGALPLVASRARRLGYQRAAIVVLPFHETLPFEAAFGEQVRRLNAMTAILDDNGIALGLEYVSPISRRAPYPHSFLHTMAGMLRLCDALDSPAAGLLLDSFHWHCAGESVADIERLTAKQIVCVHVNDAPDIPVEEQTVMARALPGSTGVIDISGFMGALATIGYSGPVTCEPMASAVSALSRQGPDAIVEQVSESMDAIMPKGALRN